METNIELTRYQIDKIKKWLKTKGYLYPRWISGCFYTLGNENYYEYIARDVDLYDEMQAEERGE